MSAIFLKWLLPFVVGAATGILSGFGVGGGTLLLVYLTAVAGVEQHQAQGINLLYFLPAAAMALPGHWKNGYLERRVLLPAVLTGLLCAGGAAWLAVRLDAGWLRKLFGVFLLIVGVFQMKKPKESNEDEK